jgi:hypothetical protein
MCLSLYIRPMVLNKDIAAHFLKLGLWAPSDLHAVSVSFVPEMCARSTISNSTERVSIHSDIAASKDLM